MTTAVPRSSARQTTINAYLNITLAMLVTTVDTPVIELPAGAVLSGGSIVVTAVFNSTSSDVISLGDATTYNRYKSALDITTLGYTALVPTGYIYTVPTLLTARWVSGGGTPTTGAVRIHVAYYKIGRADLASQGLDYGARLA